MTPKKISTRQQWQVVQTWRAELSRQPPGEQNLLKKLHMAQPHVDLLLEEPAQQNDRRPRV